VNVSDGNPGVFVRMLNELQVGAHTVLIPPETQHSTLVRLAASWHEWSRALYAQGRLLHGVIGSLGRTLSARLHSRRIADEDVDQETNQLQLNLESLNADLAEAFRVGARHALFVAQEIGAPLRYPEGDGVWRLAYFLAPKFWLLPRKGRVARVVEGQLQFGFAKDASTVEVEPGDARGDAEAEAI
jgi:hypothetical protein